MEENGKPRALDPSDLDRLYRRYGALVFRRARRILADEQLARDVCQDVFVKLLRAGETWESPSPIGWLYRTTTNCCLNLIRGTRRWRTFLHLLPPPPVATPSLPTQLLLQGIPRHLQEIAIFYGLDQMSQQEIALVLGLSQKTVSNRIRELRSWLEDAETKPRVEQK
jgi:DNA-directed RNA polymerase specialized sigma24 family protein